MATHDFRALVIAGRRRGDTHAGGGGAGGYQENATLALTESTSYAITVGVGGAASVNSNNAGSSGGASSIGTTLVSDGGEGGGSAGAIQSGVAGGSGGGGGDGTSLEAGGAGTAGQGNVGGAATIADANAPHGPYAGGVIDRRWRHRRACASSSPHSGSFRMDFLLAALAEQR
jgi:hypothetical protein